MNKTNQEGVSDYKGVTNYSPQVGTTQETYSVIESQNQRVTLVDLYKITLTRTYPKSLTIKEHFKGSQ